MKKNYTSLLSLVLLASSLLSCSGPQSMFPSIGSEGDKVITIWYILFALGVFVFLAFMIFLLLGLLKKPEESFEKKYVSDDKKLLRKLYGATSFIIVVLVGLLVSSHLNSPRQKIYTKPDVTIRITGLQYWWRIEYLDSKDNVIFETANELKIPINKKIHFILETDDVIHSFWVPSIAGKVDMIPGRKNNLYVTVDKLGRFRGQCAEFCGIQHAKMSMYIDVVSAKDFDNYLHHQEKDALALTHEINNEGKSVFNEVGCIKCHTIRGDWNVSNNKNIQDKSDQNGLDQIRGPDLTHLMSRQTLAAGTIPNTTGHLSGWVIDSQSPKKGNLMPISKMSSKDLKSLLMFLERLK